MDTEKPELTARHFGLLSVGLKVCHLAVVCLSFSILNGGKSAFLIEMTDGMIGAELNVGYLGLSECSASATYRSLTWVTIAPSSQSVLRGGQRM